MTDREFLGLPRTFTEEELKASYRRLSKRFHPDRNGDSLKSHLAMIRLNRAYGNLRDRAGVPPRATGEGSGKDDSYGIYREGIGLFQSIHPSRWKSVSRKGLFDPGAVETRPETAAIIDSLIKDMARAYSCFSRIVNEYGQSPWYEDSRLKMGEIEKMTGRYARIRESYGKGQ